MLLSSLFSSSVRTLVAFTAVNLLHAASGLLIPLALGAAVDAALGTGDGSTALLTLGLLLGFATIAEAVNELFEVSTAAKARAGLRNRLIRHLLRLDLGGLRRHTGGDLLSRTLEGAGTAAMVVPATVTAVVSLLTSIGGVVALLLVDPWTGFAFCLGAPVAWFTAKGFLRRSSELTRDYQRVQSELSNRFMDAIRGIRTIRASGTVDREVERVLGPLPALRAAGMGFWRAQRNAGWQMATILPLVSVAVVGTAGHGLLTGRNSAGDLATVTGYLGFATGIFRQVNILGVFGRIRGSASRVAELLSIPPAGSGTKRFSPGLGEIRLSEVGVDGVLSGLDVVIPGGSSVAVVGVSGSGKSVFALLAGGLLQPDEGRVTIDGTDLKDAAPGELAGVVSYAFERPFLLGETVGQAVSYSDRPVDDTAITAALHAGDAYDFVARLPQGRATTIADLRVSGGETQRLGLARAFSRSTRVTILDDALSSVDSATEERISAALRERAGTRIVVTNRLSTAARSDLVLWLADGGIAGFARHDSLLQHSSYASMFGLREAIRAQ